MATDLFGKYYNNPTKSYIYSSLLCNGESADEISFDISNDNGVISSNGEDLSKIDLTNIHVGVSQYTNDMRVIEPKQYIYVKGMSYGKSYMKKSYGFIPNEMKSDEYWKYKTILFFVIRYTDKKTGIFVVNSIKVQGSLSEETTFEDAINKYLEEKEIPVSVSTEENDSIITFASSEPGYEIWADHMLLWKSDEDADILGAIDDWIRNNGKEYEYGWSNGTCRESSPELRRNVYSCIIKKNVYEKLYNLFACLESDFNTILENNNVKKVYLFEILSKYVPAIKYRNGAMKGVVMSATYPIYNAEEIDTYDKCLKIGFLKDRVKDYAMIPESITDGTLKCVRNIVDVIDSYCSESEIESYSRWKNDYTHIDMYDDWIESDEIIHPEHEMFEKWYHTQNINDSSLWESSSVETRRMAKSICRDFESKTRMGLNGYCVYLSKHGMWENMAQSYIRTTVDDNPEYSDSRNLIPSFIVYNPNDFPVTINYMTFV